MRAHCRGAPFSRGIDTRTPTAPGLAGVSQRLTVAHRSLCSSLAAAPAGADVRAASEEGGADQDALAHALFIGDGEPSVK